MSKPQSMFTKDTLHARAGEKLVLVTNLIPPIKLSPERQRVQDCPFFILDIMKLSLQGRYLHYSSVFLTFSKLTNACINPKRNFNTTKLFLLSTLFSIQLLKLVNNHSHPIAKDTFTSCLDRLHLVKKGT